MKRRSFLGFGMVTGTVLLVGGSLLALTRPGFAGGRLTPEGREVFSALGTAILDGLWPAEAGPRRTALHTWLDAVEATVAGLHPSARQELGTLTTVLVHPVGRRLLAGLESDWGTAAPADVAAALQALRESNHSVRQQAYHGLRDLCYGAFFSQPSSWQAIGYPGPRAL